MDISLARGRKGEAHLVGGKVKDSDVIVRCRIPFEFSIIPSHLEPGVCLEHTLRLNQIHMNHREADAQICRHMIVLRTCESVIILQQFRL